LIVSSLVVFLYAIFVFQQSDPLQQPSTSIIACSMSTITYAVISWLYVSRIANRKWKIVTVVLFFSVHFGIILTYVFIWFSHWVLLSNLLLGADTFLLILYTLYKRTCELLQEDQYTFFKLAELPTRFMLKDLEKATENFRLKIGQGGSGTIFKGFFSDGSAIAVKHVRSQQNGANEFITEINIIASLQHINLVHLLGYCLAERGDRYLVYPFFENGSLDTWLFADEEKRRHLTWVLRYKIAVDVAKALAYLHHDCRHRILHLDVKPANILLDGSFQALVSDFSISRSMERDMTNVMITARGTVHFNLPLICINQPDSHKLNVIFSDDFDRSVICLQRCSCPRLYQLNLMYIAMGWC
jgi:Protein kinase domain